MTESRSHKNRDVFEIITGSEVQEARGDQQLGAEATKRTSSIFMATSGGELILKRNNSWTRNTQHQHVTSVRVKHVVSQMTEIKNQILKKLRLALTFENKSHLKTFKHCNSDRCFAKL